MAFSKHYSWWLFTVLCCLFIGAGYCQVTEEDETMNEKERDPIQEGMDPLYRMTSSFLGVVQSESKENLIDLIQDNNESGGLGNWQTWIKHYMGFLICAAIGLVFILVMPIVGLFFCCCRLCGKCGGKVKEKRGKHYKCQMITCSILFAVFSILILAGMVCAFVTNELLRQQTSQAENAVVPTVVSSLERLESFKVQLLMDLNDKVIQKAVKQIDASTDSLQEIPAAVTTAISASSGYEAAIEDLEVFVERTEQIGGSLEQIQNLTEQLTVSTQALETEINEFRNRFSADSAVSGCTTACTAVKNDVNALSVNSTAIVSLPNVTAELNNIHAVLANDLPQIIKKGKSGLVIITRAIYNGTSIIINLSAAAVDYLSQNISTAGNDMETQLNEQVSIKKQIDQVKSYEDDVETYGDYRFYAGVGLCCLLLLIVLFSVLGALIGSCASPPSDDAGVCNKGVGANLLMASVGFIFIFTWLLMAVVVVLFLVGGLLHTEVCRVIVDVENSPAIETLDNAIEEIVRSQNSSINLKISDILGDCKKNEPIYQVLHLEEVVNLTDILNLDKYNVKDEINKLKNVTVPVPVFDIYTDEMKTQLAALKASGVDSINFDAFAQISPADILTGDLKGLAESMDTLADSQTGTLKTQLEAYADELEIFNTQFGVVQVTLANLKQEATECSELIAGSTNKTYSEQVTAIENSLQQADNKMRDDWVNATTDALAGVANGIIDDIQIFLNELVELVETDLARCEPVYRALDDSIHSVCVSLLEPFNGFWFSFGWCLFFFIPSLIVAVHLVGLYRRLPVDSRYRADNNKAFDDPRNGGRYGNGNQNTGYQRDDYTASRAAYHRADSFPDKQYDPGYQQRGYQQSHNAASAPTPPNPPHYHNGQKYYN